MITVLTGNNQFALRDALTKLKQDFIAIHGAAGLEQYQATALTTQELQQIIMTTSLFATHRLVVISDLAANKPLSEYLLEIMEDVPTEVQLVLVEPQLDKRTAFYKTLHKAGLTQEYGELSEAELLKWIYEYTEQQGGVIKSPAARQLVAYVGNDQLRLSLEIDKLAAYQPEITAETIAELVGKSPQDTIFQLLEQSLGGQTNQALQTLKSLEQSFADPFQIVNMLIWQAHIIAVTHSAGDAADNEIAKQFKLSPFVVQKSRRLAGRLSGKELKKIIQQIAKLDVTLKSSSANPWRSLEATILSF